MEKPGQPHGIFYRYEDGVWFIVTTWMGLTNIMGSKNKTKLKKKKNTEYVSYSIRAGLL